LDLGLTVAMTSRQNPLLQNMALKQQPTKEKNRSNHLIDSWENLAHINLKKAYIQISNTL